MVSTPDRIIDYLKKNSTASALELSRLLSLTPPNIRHHLKEMLIQGQIDRVQAEHNRSRGRPTYLYRLSGKFLEHNLSVLARALLEGIGNISDMAIQEDLLKKTAAQIAGPLSEPNPHLVQRFNQTIRKLNELQYHARWEASPHGPKICLMECPYALLLAKNPLVCKIDQFVLEYLLHLPVQQSTQRQANSKNNSYCTFILAKNR